MKKLLFLGALAVAASPAGATVCDNNGNCASSPQPQAPPVYVAPAPQPPAHQDIIAVMTCYPEDGQQYVVRYDDDAQMSSVISARGVTRDYPVIEVSVNQSNHILYVRAKRADQDRTLYYAFDFSGKTDKSAIRVVAPGVDNRDKCYMKWS